MSRTKSLRIWLVVVSAVVLCAFLLWTWRVVLGDWVREWRYEEALPTPQPVSEFRPRTSSPPPSKINHVLAPSPLLAESTAAPRLLKDVNLAVPFAPQAPTANWEQPYQDACEEAALVMVERYLKGAGITPSEMDREILRMVDFQTDRFGFFKDTNTAETVRLAEGFFSSLAAQAFYDVTVEDIKEQLAEGHPVIALVDGRLLGNPFYTQPGPDKHAIVIKGFKGTTFITNDPGTKRGADFVYPVETVMEAMVDYDGGEAGTGKRAIIVLTQRAQ